MGVSGKKKQELGTAEASELNKTLLSKWSWGFAIERGATCNEVMKGNSGSKKDGAFL